MTKLIAMGGEVIPAGFDCWKNGGGVNRLYMHLSKEGRHRPTYLCKQSVRRAFRCDADIVAVNAVCPDCLARATAALAVAPSPEPTRCPDCGSSELLKDSNGYWCGECCRVYDKSMKYLYTDDPDKKSLADVARGLPFDGTPAPRVVVDDEARWVAAPAGDVAALPATLSNPTLNALRTLVADYRILKSATNAHALAYFVDHNYSEIAAALARIGGGVQR